MKIQVKTQFDKRDLDLIKKVSAKRGDAISDFIRISTRKELARLGFLTKEETKALGVDIS